MYLAQVEHCWLNDYVTVSASVSGELLPTSVTFHEVTQSINLLTAHVLLFRHEIPGTNRRQDTHSLSVGPVTVTVDSVVGAPLPASGFFKFARRTGWYIVGRTACWICWPTLYFRLYRSLRIESEGSDSGKRAAVQRTTASVADAMGPLFTTFCACAHNCIYIPRMREV